MRVLVCQTQDICPIGTVGDALDAAGLERVTWRTGAEAPPATLDGLSAVVALGGAASPDDDLRYPWLAQQREVLDEALERRLPTLGLCLGAQLLSQAGGGEVGQLERPEIGWIEVTSTADGRRDRVYGTMPERHRVLSWHDHGFTLPPGATLLAGTETAVQAFRIGDRAWGLQYHLEANAAIAAGWIAHYADELRARGPQPSVLARETARFAAAQARHADEFGAAFARLAAYPTAGRNVA